MNRISTLTALGALAAATLLSGCAMDHDADHGMEGTYKLISRELPDGTRQSPPQIAGMLMFDDGWRNFNVYGADQQGRVFSIGAIAKYNISGNTYEETNVYYFINDEVFGAGQVYDLSNTTGRAAITHNGDSYALTFPLHSEPDVVFDKAGFVATKEGAFVDTWERVDD